MADTPRFVTDDEGTIALRVDRIMSVQLVVEDDKTKGRASLETPDGFEIAHMKEGQARQIIRRLKNSHQTRVD